MLDLQNKKFYGIETQISLEDYIAWLESLEGIQHTGMVSKHRGDSFNETKLALILNYNQLIKK